MVRVLIILLCLLYGFNMSCKNHKVNTNDWKITYATLYRSGYGRGGVNSIWYTANKKKYFYDGSFACYGSTLGDMYLIKYNPKNPNEIEEYIWEVGFLKDEKTNEAVGEINRIFSYKIDLHALTFVFYANGIKYERTQYLPPDYKKKYPTINEAKKYLVRFLQSNPQRAVIYLKNNN